MSNLRTLPLWLAALLLSGPATLYAAGPTKPSRPNVLFILCDDIRWNAMSCAGHPTLKTPNIDRIANEGVRFANMFCTTSLCSPSRASILTGLYAHTHGVHEQFHRAAHEPRPLADAAARVGLRDRLSSASGTWARTTTRRGPASTSSPPTRARANTSTPSGTSTAAGTKLHQGLLHDHRHRHGAGLAASAITAASPGRLCIGHKAPHSFYTPEEKYAHVFDGVRVPYPDTAFHLDDKPTWIKRTALHLARHLWPAVRLAEEIPRRPARRRSRISRTWSTAIGARS